MDRKQLGSSLKKIRKQQGLRITDIANKEISTTSISNIENGVESVQQKYIDVYCKKLNVKLNDIPLLIDKENKSVEHKLTFIEANIDIYEIKRAQSDIKELLKTDESDNYLDVIHYLKAQCYFNFNNRKDLNKAKKLLTQAMEKTKNPMRNIRSVCYKELAKIVYYRDYDLYKALQYTHEGLKSFKEEGERKEIKYFLLVGKASYLEKLNETDKALEILLDLWKEIHEIDNLEVKLTMFEIRALCHNKKGYYDRALEYATKGFKLAYSNQKYERMFELLTTWGNINMKKKDFHMAEECYLRALELRPKLKRKYLCVSPYTELGKLYTKLEKWNHAKQHLELAVIEGEKADIHRRNEPLIAYGDFYLAQKMYFEALEPYQTSLAISEKYNFENHQQAVLLNLSECWDKLHEQDKYLETARKLQLLLKRIQGGENNETIGT